MLLTKGREHEVARNDLPGSFQEFRSLFRLSLANAVSAEVHKKEMPTHSGHLIR